MTSIKVKSKKQKTEQSLFHFMQDIITQLKLLNRVRTSETYAATLNSFMKFRDRKDILLCEIDSDTMMLYEAWLKRKSVCPNTISFYMRILRAVYNRAVGKKLVEQKHPFKHVYTGIDKTFKRAISLQKIQEIKQLDLSAEKQVAYARDLFLFSFYTRGMSFVDMAFLKKEDLQNGVLVYRRRKTGQLLSIKWEVPMQDIVDKYDTAGTPYLLPLIKANGRDEWRQYKSASHLVNRKLKRVGDLLDLPVKLTMYVARHAWASIAKSKNVSMSVISEAMGHDSEMTTRIYLSTLDTSLVDRANELILQSL